MSIRSSFVLAGGFLGIALATQLPTEANAGNGDLDALEKAVEQYKDCRYQECGKKKGPEIKACRDACDKKYPKEAAYFKVQGCRVDCLEHPPLDTKRFDCFMKCSTPWNKFPYAGLAKCKKNSGDFKKCAVAALNGEPDPGSTPAPKKSVKKIPEPEFAGSWDGYLANSKGEQVGSIAFKVDSSRTKVTFVGFTQGNLKCDPPGATVGMVKSTDGKPAFLVEFFKGCSVKFGKFVVKGKFKTLTESENKGKGKSASGLVTPVAVGELDGKWAVPDGKYHKKGETPTASISLSFVVYRSCEKDAECKGKGERCINIPGASFGTCGVLTN